MLKLEVQHKFNKLQIFLIGIHVTEKLQIYVYKSCFCFPSKRSIKRNDA